MALLTETRHAGTFIISDSGNRSYEEGTVASGQDLDAGELVMKSAGNLVAWDGATASTVVGVLVYAIDATGGAKKAAYLARDAEVRWDDLTYPASTETLAKADLNLLGIAYR